MGPVGPLRVVSPLVDRLPVVDFHLRDDERTGIRVPDTRGELGADVLGRVVEDRVHGVEPKTVDVVVPNPELCVLDRPFAHGRLAVIDRVAPERFMLAREIRPEHAQRLVARTDVVVDDVEEHCEPGCVRSIDETREPVRPAVRAVRR